MVGSDPFDVVIIGGGIGGVICLYFAKKAGLNAVLLERQEGVGGIWRTLPGWQDIQFRREDWTLGDIPIAGEDQASILGNVQAWVDRFALAPHIRLNAEVTSARPVEGGWMVSTGAAVYRSRFLVAATGGHNRPIIPPVPREQPEVQEFHSSALRHPEGLSGKRVVVVGGGASAYDLLDLCFEYQARKVIWVYRSLRWMRPTRHPKYSATDMRFLARQQMMGVPVQKMNRFLNQDMRARYQKAGIQDILPEQAFDIQHQQLIPGRHRMIERFSEIERHRGEVSRIAGRTLEMSDGATVEADLVLWGTGYEVDLRYFDIDGLSRVTRLQDLTQRCGSLFRSLDAPNLFFLAPGVLETSGSTPWAYAHACRSIMSHIRGKAAFGTTPLAKHINYFDLAKFLAPLDRANFPRGLWFLQYLYRAFRQPRGKPMPIP